MYHIAVYGIGSPFGEDRVGYEVISLLQQTDRLKPYIPDLLQLKYLDRPGPSLLEHMKVSNIVFLIDAMMTGAMIGTLHRYHNQEITQLQSHWSTHQLGVVHAIQLGTALNCLPDEIILLGIEIDKYSFHDSLSPAVKEGIKKLAIEIEKEIILHFVSRSNEQKKGK